MSNTITLEDVWKLFRETDRKFQETDRLIQNVSKEIDRMSQEVSRVSREIGNLGGKWGTFLENRVAPGCETLFAERGIPVHEVYPRVRTKRDDGASMEIDLMVVNSGAVVLVEVKSTLTIEDVRYHLQRLQRFKEFFPRYADCRVIGAVAGIDVSEQAETFARKQGLFIILQAGENLTLANEADFEPRTW